MVGGLQEERGLAWQRGYCWEQEWGALPPTDREVASRASVENRRKCALASEWALLASASEMSRVRGSRPALKQQE